MAADAAQRRASGAARPMTLVRAVYPEDNGTVPVDELRAACCAGELGALPAWVRTQVYKVLLGYVTPDKDSWLATLRRRRAEYVQFLADFCDERPWAVGSARSPDRVLNQIYQDLFRAAGADPTFYDTRAAWPSDARHTRHVLLDRLERINSDFYRAAARDRPYGARFVDRQWHAVLRILFLFAMLNPSVGYIQGMNEVLYVLLRAFFSARDAHIAHASAVEREILGVESTANAEADAFWCFSLLIGSLREVYDFGHADATTFEAIRTLAQPLHEGARAPENGLAAALHRMSTQLAGVDPSLAHVLAQHHLDPRHPYYSLRWLVCLYACEFPWQDVLWIWDVLLAQKREQPGADSSADVRISFLLDVGCAILIHLRRALLELAQVSPDVFQQGMLLLRPHADHSVERVLAIALDLLEKRRRQEALPRTSTGRRSPPPKTRANRNAALQERLAATVHRSLKTPPLRSATWTPGLPAQPSAPGVPPSAKPSALSLEGLPRAAETVASPSAIDDAPHTDPPRTPGKEPPPESHSTPSTPSMASSGRALFRRYTEAIQDSNAAASVSKARTNLAAKALAWRSASGSVAPASAPPVERPAAATDAPQLPIPSVVDSPEDRDAFRVMARPPTGLAPDTTPNSDPARRLVERSPTTSEDDSMCGNTSNSAQLVLPSMRKAAQMGLLRTPPIGDVSDLAAPLSSTETSPKQGAGLTRRIPSGQRTLARRLADERPRRGSRRLSTDETRLLPGFTPVSPQRDAPPRSTDHEPAAAGGHTKEHLDALLHELQTTEWIRDK